MIKRKNLIKTLLVFVILLMNSNITMGQTSLNFEELNNGVIKVTNGYGTTVGYVKTDPYDDNSYIIYNKNGKAIKRITKNRRGIQTNPLLLEAFKSQQALNTSSVDYDKLDESLDDMNKSIDQSIQSMRDYYRANPEAYKRMMAQKRERIENRRNKREKSKARKYIKLDDDGSAKDLKKQADMYEFDDKSKAGVINKQTKIYDTPNNTSEPMGSLAKGNFVELRKINGDYAYVSYENPKKVLSYGWINLRDFSYYID